jgi:hypothetical protein
MKSLRCHFEDLILVRSKLGDSYNLVGQADMVW